MNSQPEIKQPHSINCPCGCKALEGDDAIKRHLKILACIVFVATLGLVAVCSMARDNEGAAEPEMATVINYPPGAIQAAEGSFPVMTPTQSSPRVYAVVPMQAPDQMQMQMQYQVPVSTQGVVALPMTGVSQIRPEMPSHLTMAITSMDGKTKIKRIAGR